ncbi:hypothetical protein [Halorhabdus rudnickae]|uniref:hypothetical protein n=1 Tax=Halorhabdus rudnickae TaxID=1775544 RepID=UPI0010828F6C|nr:hypothetical protein [Halorhabdus rudnickae]
MSTTADDGETGEGASAESVTFEFEAQETVVPDVWVEETFENRYGDQRAVLAGDTYDVLIEKGVKDELDWDQTHHKWNERREEWIVDADALDHLQEVADKHGATVAAEIDEIDDAETGLREAAETVEEGDRITVEYLQKNGNGMNSKEGTIWRAPSRRNSPAIVFERDDGQTMRVKHDEFGDVGLFTGGHHPFVGSVSSITIER